LYRSEAETELLASGVIIFRLASLAEIFFSFYFSFVSKRKVENESLATRKAED
jgi:hypothetical protein